MSKFQIGDLVAPKRHWENALPDFYNKFGVVVSEPMFLNGVVYYYVFFGGDSSQEFAIDEELYEKIG